MQPLVPETRKLSANVSALHRTLVDTLKHAGNIRTAPVEAAFRAVPRHLFLPSVAPEEVYQDVAITTRQLDGQAVSSSSQPAVMANMLEQLSLEPGHRVLEIGAGTGYNAALMAHIVGPTGSIVTIDIDEDIVAHAREHLTAAGFNHVQVICGDGVFGWPDAAPYDRIILTVGAGDIVPAWPAQLSVDGRLVVPLVLKVSQKIVVFEPIDGGLASISVRSDVLFMPLRGTLAGSETAIRLGSDEEITLVVDNPRTVDAAATYATLGGPVRDWPTTVRLTPRELTGAGLATWLELRNAGFCTLFTTGTAVQRGLVPYLMGSARKFRFTFGLRTETTLALVMRPPGTVPPATDIPEERDPGEFTLFVRSIGPDVALAQLLCDQIATWDAAGRPTDVGLHIKVYPANSGGMASDGAVVLRKHWSQLVCEWR